MNSPEGKKLKDHIAKVEREWERRRNEAVPLDIVAHRKEMENMRKRAMSRLRKSRKSLATEQEILKVE